MLKVQHFMKHHVFDHCKRDLRRVEESGDEDRVVADVESAEHMPGLFDGPRNVRLRYGSGEVLAVEPVEHLVQIDVPSERSPGPCWSTSIVSSDAGALLNRFAQNESPVRAVM